MTLKTHLAAIMLSLAAYTAHAATVLSVDGPDSGSTAMGAGLPDVGVAQTFTLTETLTDASFGFNVRCFSCGGEIWLIEGRMSRSVLNRQVVAKTAYSMIDGVQSALTNLDLVANTYTIIMTMTSGQGLWRATDAPVTTGNVGTVDNGYRSFSQVDPNFLPWSPTLLITGKTLEFSISTPDADPPVMPIPLPASALFLLAGLFAMRAVGRRKA